MLLSNTVGMLLVLTQACLGASEFFAQSTLGSAYDRLYPAIGLLTFSSEITNPNTGEIIRRDNNALGLVVSSDGLVMTHGHLVLENSQPFNIRLTLGIGSGNEQRFDAVLLEKPSDVNVAFLRLQSDEPLNLPYVQFATNSNLNLGTPVTVMGLLGDTLDYIPAILEGRVGAVLEKPRLTYCLDIQVRFGYVGGPVINTAGAVIGVIGFDLSPNEGGDLYIRSGHPLIFQSELFQRYIASPPGTDEEQVVTEEAWLGVYTQPLTDDFATYWELEKTGGLIISTVVAGSPAANAGLQPGDVIVAFNEIPIRAKLDREVLGFTQLVREAGAGQETNIVIVRNGERQEKTILLGTRPIMARDAEEFEDPIFGLTVRELTTDVRIALNLSEDVQGVIVRRVRSGSVAQLARMRPGVIILTLGNFPTPTLLDFQEAVERVQEERPNEVAVFARFGNATGFFRLEPRWGTNE